jgi:uncharacterized membrane protein
MAGELISPNLHVVLIHFPLALLVAGTFIELFSFLWRRSSLRQAARWMILLGALAAVPATFSGLFALKDIASRNNPAGETNWADVKAASPILKQPDVWHVLWNHTLLQSGATALCVFVVVFWLACSDHARKSLHLPLMVLLLVGVGAILFGASFGGDSVYRRGVGVEPPSAADDVDPAKAQQLPFAFERWVPPVEMHVILAGTVFAIALVSIGLSIRKITATIEIKDRQPITATETTLATKSPRTPPTPVAMARTFNPDIEVTLPPFAPAARFWLLAAAVALLTFAAGWFIIADDTFSVAREHHQSVGKALVNQLWEEIKPQADRKVNRAMVHVVCGTTIMITPLILAGLARFAPRRRFWLALFTAILVIAVAVQIWMGILLLFDTGEGPLTRFGV